MTHRVNRTYSLAQLERWARRTGYQAEAEACRRHRTLRAEIHRERPR